YKNTHTVNLAGEDDGCMDFYYNNGTAVSAQTTNRLVLFDHGGGGVTGGTNNKYNAPSLPLATESLISRITGDYNEPFYAHTYTLGVVGTGTINNSATSVSISSSYYWPFAGSGHYNLISWNDSG